MCILSGSCWHSRNQIDLFGFVFQWFLANKIRGLMKEQIYNRLAVLGCLCEIGLYNFHGKKI